jgi:enoyl-[acyl-carrier protein] reductase I
LIGHLLTMHCMKTIDLSNKVAVVFGVANHRSIAWSITSILRDAGATVALSYQNERLKKSLDKLTSDWDQPLLVECDVSEDSNIEKAFHEISNKLGKIDIVVHSIAFANREDLGGRFVDTSREGYNLALEISSYSLLPITKFASEHMPEGGNILTMSFQAAEKVFPGYNVMSTAKAALESEVRQLAHDMGSQNIRVNAISAGPVDTLSSRVIAGYTDMKQAAAERSPLGKNITTQDVAKTALYLCSDLSSGVTGEVIHVDSGYHVMGI